jgi:dipeptidyl aminopeptidase/acylaminoacyl peptidase
MRSLRVLAALSALVLTTITSVATAQRTGGPPVQPAANANPQGDLPYGATSAAPVSRWTPPASVGRQLTLNDLLTWKSVRTPQLTNDGKYFAYILAPNEGDAEAIVRGTENGATERRFPVGDGGAGAGGGGGQGGGGGAAAAISFSGNSKWLAFLVRPNVASATRGRGTGGAGSGEAATPSQPKLAIVNLATGEKREFDNVRAYRFAGDGSDWLAIHHSAPQGATGGGGGGATGGAAARPSGPPASVLELVDLAGTSAMNIQVANVSEFAFDDAGRWMACAISATDEIGNGIQLRELTTGVTRSLDAQKASYRSITWADSSHSLAVLRIVRDTADGDDDVTVLAWRDAMAVSAARPSEVSAKSTGVPGGLVLSSDRAPQWSDDRARVFFGLREPRPKPDAAASRGGAAPAANAPAPGAGAGGQIAAAPQTGAEVPSLILWHWRDGRPQSQQQVQETQDRNFSFLAVFDIGASRVTRLSDERMRSVTIGPKSTWGIGVDDRDYEREAGLRGFNYRDLYAVDLTTGERTLIQKKVPGGGGVGATAFTPDNRKVAYYDTGHWKVYDFTTRAERTVSEGVPARFWNTEDDHNQVKPAIGGGFVGWSRDGEQILVRDNWDMWRLPVNGRGAVNLTRTFQRDQIRIQARLLSDPRTIADGIDLSQPLFLETYGEWTKKEGLSRVDLMTGGATTITWEDAKVDYRRARDADTWVFSRQTVKSFPDWYASDAALAAAATRRLTNANPQQSEVAWSPGAVLIDYTCDNGLGRRQAALYLPAGYEKGKRYPALTYIYEKLSQGFHVYPQPNATRYANPAVYTSRGYAYLQPDIAYKVNEPGRSAVWCVLPAVKAAIAAGYLDPDRIGLQGHSWGGYQTAFITTQTKIFKTGAAGAPLTDMTSMFGSVYWNTGSTDASIFIASQGRFTGSPNDIPEAYDRNSPQVFANNLSIPLMLLHNDRDGAVDFNQGITYYNHLRHLEKEVVLLEYVGENHGLARSANQKDYALRMTEWFDTFLRDQPAPDWLKDGIPRLKMEQHLKDRRVMVDPKATPTAPKVIP